MNILHVSNIDLIGGRFNGYYMNKSLSNRDRSEMAVWIKQSDDENVHRLSPHKPSMLWLISSIIKRLDSFIGLDGITGLGGLILQKQPYYKESDILHLHLIHNNVFFSILSLIKITTEKPVVWTIHDAWATTGMCIYSFECTRWQNGCNGKCPHPRGKSPLRSYLPALHWRIKKSIYKKLNLEIIVASNLMLDRVKKSPLLNHFPCHLIPFGIDLNEFVPRSKQQSREKLGLPPDQNYIAFRGINFIEDNYKGMQWLMEALVLYDPKVPTNLLILQDGAGFKSLSPKYQVFDFGWVDGELLVDILCAADIFVMPSIQEAFGLMAIEAMACGTPVIVFENTALPEVIFSPNGGLAVPYKDSNALANAISKLMSDENYRLNLGIQARTIAEMNYSFELYVQKHLEVYKRIIDKPKNT